MSEHWLLDARLARATLFSQESVIITMKETAFLEHWARGISHK